MLSEPSLDEADRKLVLEEMERKCRILAAGFEKRGNAEEARRYIEILRTHGLEK